MSAALDRLAGEKYVLLTTFRKDGRAVPTPVWAARDGDRLLIWSAADAGKVKRVRRDGAVRVAPCDARGRPNGEAVTAHASLLEPATVAHTLDLLRSKYGLLGRLVILGSRLRRGTEGAATIAVTFD